MDHEEDKKRRQELVTSCVLILIVCVYLGLHAGHAVYENTDGSGEIDYSMALVQLEEEIARPFAVWPFNTAVLLLIVLAGSILCLYQYQAYVWRLGMMPGREHGSAAFNHDYRRLMRGFVMSPSLLIERELEVREIKDKNQREKIKKRMESRGRYRIDRVYFGRTGRKLCRKRFFTRSEISWCLRNSQLCSKRVALSMDTKMTQLNLNCIVFGGSGSGKSRYFVKPNLLQANSSYVVTDPSGELLMSCGAFLEKAGYEVRCFNLEDMTRSLRYNPFAYVMEDSDIPIMIEALIDNIEGPKKGGGDNNFWEETSRTLLIAVCGYLLETQPLEKRNFNNVLRLLEMADVSDGRKEEMDDLDLLFGELEKKNPESYALSQYRVIKQAGTGKTAQNIFISTSAIFARFFRLERIANLTYKDELHLEDIGRKKTALFIVTPQGDTTYNFLASLLYTQLFTVLYRQGEDNAASRGISSVELDMPVRCLIDEAANIGVIPGFPQRLATMRKYGISCAPIYQNLAQLKEIFKDSSETVLGNCDTTLFLGGIDASTVKMISERLGQTTVSVHNQSQQKGKRGTNTETVNTIARCLMTTTELEQMDNTMCITIIRTMKPFLDYKYPYEKHPCYRYTGDADPKNNYTGLHSLKYDKEEVLGIAIQRPVRKTDGEETKEDLPDISKSIRAQDPAFIWFMSGENLQLSTPVPGEEGIYEDVQYLNTILEGNLKRTEIGRALLQME